MNKAIWAYNRAKEPPPDTLYLTKKDINHLVEV